MIIKARTSHKPSRLLTISTSHYCEAARWALERLQVPYIEERHVPLLNRLAIRQSDALLKVPVLITPMQTLGNSADILRYLDLNALGRIKLYPADPQLRRQVNQLEDLFNRQLGPSTWLWFYAYLLENRSLMIKLLGDGVPLLERILFPLLFPLVRQGIQQDLMLTADSAEKCYVKIKSIFESVNELLADGRRYLVGNHFSAADLTFAALAALALFPSEYSVKLPQLDEIPSEMATGIEALRATPAGKYALRLFREERMIGTN